MQWCFFHDQPEMFIEIGETVVPGFITDICNGVLSFNQQFTGMADTQFDQEPGKGFACSGFKIAAKRIRGQVGDLRDLFKP